MSEALWQLRDVRVAGEPHVRLAADGPIPPGRTAVIGFSGAGKTTLLNLLVGFERPDRGTADGPFVSADRLPMYWVPQQHGLWPHLTVRDHLRTVAETPPRGDNPDGCASLVDRLLTDLDLEGRADARPAGLSVGERARVSVARALAARPAVVVMDEPLAHVDPARAGRYWSAIRGELEAAGSSLVFATHAPETVLAEAENVVCLRDGEVVFTGAVADAYWNPPTPAVAACLGRTNWLEPAEARIWVDGEPSTPCCRPEQLEVSPAADGPLLVRSTRHGGAVGESVLEHGATGRRRVFTHRPARTLAAGQRVTLRLCAALLLMSLLAACGSQAADARLPVRAVRTWSVPTEGAKLPAPRAVTFGEGGKAYALDTAGRVLVVDAGGELLRSWQMPKHKVGTAEGICQLADGRLAVADTHYSRVVIFRPDGTVADTFGQKGEGPGEFIYPVGVAQDAAGMLYVCEYGSNDRVQKFRPDGTFVASFGTFGTGPDQFQRPSGMAVVAGKLYVADALNGRIQVFSTEGEHLTVLGGEDPPTLDLPYDLAAAGGRLYVVEYGAGRLTALTRSGRVVGRWGRRGRGPRSMSTPWGLAVSTEGDGTRLLIADTGNRRILEVGL